MQQVWFLMKVIEVCVGVCCMTYHILGFTNYAEPMAHSVYFCGVFFSFTAYAMGSAIGICFAVWTSTALEIMICLLGFLTHFIAAILSMAFIEEDFHNKFLDATDEPQHLFFLYNRSQSFACLMAMGVYLLHLAVACDVHWEEYQRNRKRLRESAEGKLDEDIMNEMRKQEPIKLVFLSSRMEEYLNKIRCFSRMSGQAAASADHEEYVGIGQTPSTFVERRTRSGSYHDPNPLASGNFTMLNYHAYTTKVLITELDEKKVKFVKRDRSDTKKTAQSKFFQKRQKKTKREDFSSESSLDSAEKIDAIQNLDKEEVEEPKFQPFDYEEADSKMGLLRHPLYRTGDPRYDEELVQTSGDSESLPTEYSDWELYMAGDDVSKVDDQLFTTTAKRSDTDISYFSIPATGTEYMETLSKSDVSTTYADAHSTSEAVTTDSEDGEEEEFYQEVKKFRRNNNDGPGPSGGAGAATAGYGKRYRERRSKERQGSKEPSSKRKADDSNQKYESDDSQTTQFKDTLDETGASSADEYDERNTEDDDDDQDSLARQASSLHKLRKKLQSNRKDSETKVRPNQNFSESLSPEPSTSRDAALRRKSSRRKPMEDED